MSSKKIVFFTKTKDDFVKRQNLRKNYLSRQSLAIFPYHMIDRVLIKNDYSFQFARGVRDPFKFLVFVKVFKQQVRCNQKGL